MDQRAWTRWSCSAACWTRLWYRPCGRRWPPGEPELGGALAAFEAALFRRGTNWTRALLDLLLEDENLCLQVAAGGDAGPVLEKALTEELDLLQALGRAQLDELFHGAPDYLPRWQTDPEADYHAAYQARRPPWAAPGTGSLPVTTFSRWRTGALPRCVTPTPSA